MPALEPAATARRGPLGMARHALVEWLSHSVAVAGLLSGFHAIEALLARLSHYDRTSPAGSLFDAGDAGLIIGFLAFGVYSVLRTYGGEPDGEAADFEISRRHGRIVSPIMATLHAPPATFTISAFIERLVGHLLVYAAILVASIYLSVFILAPWQTAVGSLVALLLLAILSTAQFAPRGSLWGKLKWLKEIRATAGALAAAIALLLLIEEILRRSS